jgi:hypothetical protein
MAEPCVPGADASGEVPVPADVVERSAGGSYWSVAGGDWDGVDAALAEQLAALLAPPIVVGATARADDREPVAGAMPVEPAVPAAPPRPPVGRHRRATLELFIYRPEQPRREPSVLVPAPPRAAPGRHRRRG